MSQNLILNSYFFAVILSVKYDFYAAVIKTIFKANLYVGDLILYFFREKNPGQF